LGTAFIASSEIETIVGRLIKASITAPVKAVSPIFKLKIFLINGATILIPIKPITTDGIVAKTSIIGFNVSLNAFGASSPIKIAVPIPSGMAIIIDAIVVRREPTSKGTKPNLSCVGAHLIPPKKFIAGYPMKNLTELYKSRARIMLNTNIEMIPFRKINLWIKKPLNFENLLFLLISLITGVKYTPNILAFRTQNKFNTNFSR
jgi:hypothetical protein